MHIGPLKCSLAGLIALLSVAEAQACRQGYVWREATGPNDTVCVTPVERSIGGLQNQGYAVHDTCPQGLVWRDATTNDHRCVTPEERTLAAEQNGRARERD